MAMQPVKWIQVFNIQRVAAASEWSLPWETECFYSNATSERSSPSFPRPEKTRCVSVRNKAKLMCTMSLWPETQFQGAPQKKNKRESPWNFKEHICVCEIQKHSFAGRCIRLPLSNSLISRWQRMLSWLCERKKEQQGAQNSCKSHYWQ